MSGLNCMRCTTERVAAGKDPRQAQTRGVCNSCYVTVHNAMKAGKTTWEAEVAAGRALASKKAKAAVVAAPVDSDTATGEVK